MPSSRNGLRAITFIIVTGAGAGGFYYAGMADDRTPSGIDQAGIKAAIKQSEIIRANEQPESIREAREPYGFAFELPDDGELKATKLPGARVNRFEFSVDKLDQCLTLPEVFITELPEVTHISVNEIRVAVDRWFPKEVRGYCIAAIKPQGSATVLAKEASITIEYL